MIRNYKICIAYDGSRYYGWEHQPGKDTIQGKIGSDGSFNTTSVKASIDEGSLAGQTLNGSYNATAKTSSGLSLSGTYNIFYSNLTTPPYQWDINFSSLK